MQKQDLDPGFSQSSHCIIPGCYGKPIFAGLCNTHCTKGANQILRGTNPTETITDDMLNVAVGHDRRGSDPKMSFKYPKYYKEIPAGVTELDIYMLCHIFQVQDYSGALHHAIKKILLPGVRTGGKTRRDDIKEARDTLTRWLEINQ